MRRASIAFIALMLTTPAVAQDADLGINWTWHTTHRYIKIAVQYKNNTSRKMGRIRFKASIYNQQKNLLDTHDFYGDTRELASGATETTSTILIEPHGANSIRLGAYVDGRALSVGHMSATTGHVRTAPSQ